MRRRSSGVVIIVLMALAWSGSSALAESRIALVVGNAAYATGPLANPANDAEAVATALTRVGFAVTKLIDADQKTMRRAVVEFGRKLRGSDSVGLFYYAGHGVQIAGDNYLIPIAAEIKDEAEVPVEGVSLSDVLKTMERATSRINIVILDACRNNPLRSGSRAVAGGLAPVSAPAGSLIAFATAPGQIALDGNGPNSPYSAALAATIPVPGLILEDVFRRTRRQVLEVTRNRQTPWEHSSLTGEFYFNPRATEPETSRRDAGSASVTAAQLKEIEDWERIRGGGDAKLLKKHLDDYPDGLFAELARFKLAQAEKREKREGGGVSLANWVGQLLQADEAEAQQAHVLLERGLKLEMAGTPAALKEAFALYKQAAEAGLPAGMHRLARAFDKGFGVERDIAAAARWYRKAADVGDVRAMAALGTMHEYGEGVPLDLAEALRLYRLSAEAGEASGMASLGYLYAQGKGVARDGTQARHWYRAAAERGNVRAMYNLSLMLIGGEGGGRDYAEAAQLLQRAADHGHAGALRELALLHDQGRGVARDPRLAADYLLRAFKAGHRDARVDLIARPQSWSLATRRQVQKRLAELGLYAGRVTGLFDAATARAVEAYGQQSS
jgi:TPR repeat protein